jgi:DNA polymerase epsilon subunit 1
MATFLPPILQPAFNDRVVDYVDLMHQRKHTGGLANGAPRPTQLPIHASVFNSEKEDQTVPGTALEKTFTKPLKKEIAALIRRQRNESMHEDLAQDWAFPVLPGSHVKMSNPVLELIKSIMQVLSLDKTITLEARLLRKDLLKMFEIREFSAEGAFTNPSSTLSLKQFSCPDCCVPRDIDLCRDSDLVPILDGDNDKQRVLAPVCENCGAVFDRLAVEEKLLGEVQKMAVQWMTQDLKCAKCARIRSNEFMDHCGCAGEWVMTVKKEDLVKTLRNFQGVAKFYSLVLLGGVVEAAIAGI